MKHPLYGITGAAILAALTAAATAQQPAAKTKPKEPDELEAPAVIVTSNPLGSSLLDMVQPADALSGAKLNLRMAPTLGETLANEVGVSSSYFGPNSSRPIIRGLDGERVRILSNGAGVIDASGASPDHGVALEPLTVDRLEVVRGPAALLYGASAVGGVVNAIDNRIPTSPMSAPVNGGAQLRYGGAAIERAGAVKLDGGNERFALHVDAFKRDTSDLRIPDYARSARLRERDPLPEDEEARKRLPNSASSNDGGAVGGSVFFDKGYVGLSAAQYSSRYGTVAEPDVVIGMRKNRYDLAGEARELGVIENAKFRVGYTDYKHTEYADANPGTEFKNRGYDARVDLRHKKIGVFEGAFGFQSLESKFQATGEEAFIPPVRTTSNAAFLYEETPIGPVRLSFGGRLESTRLKADELLPNFTPAESKSFTTKSGSLGALYPFASVYAVAANMSYTERAPNYTEVFANGPHIATGQFEVGNRDQKIEKSLAFDLGLRKRSGRFTGSVGVFVNRFSNFIALLPTGNVVNVNGADFPEFVFRGVKATFRGVELDSRFHILEGPDRAMHLDLRADYTRAQNDSDGQPLPRIAPLRFTAAVQINKGAASLRFESVFARRQNRVAENELATDGYTLVNAHGSYRLPSFGLATLEVFLRATNLLNQDVRYHTSVLKDIAPLGGRAVMIGLNGAF